MPLVQVARFEDPIEGEIAASSLRAEGIEAMFNNDGMGSADPFMRRATGGFPLWVLDDDAPEARRILKGLLGLKAEATAIPRDEDDSEDDLEDRQKKRLRYRQIVLGATFLGPPLIIGLIALLAGPA